MTREEKLKAFEWLLDASEAYKVLSQGIQWDDNTVRSCSFTTGVQLSSWDNGEPNRELAKEVGITDIKSELHGIDDTTMMAWFMFNGVKFFWLEDKEDEVEE